MSLRPSGHRYRRMLAALVVAFAAGPAAQAHDVWLEPTTYAPAPGQVVGIHLLQGHGDGTAETFGRPEGRLLRFSVTHARGEEALPGLPGGDPAAYLKASVPGLLVVAYATEAQVHTLDGETFERALDEEGLDDIRRQRQRWGLTGTPATERFWRCLKAQLRPPGSQEPDSLPDRALGLALEIVLVSPPPRAGSPGLFEVRFQGEPLPGVLVRGNPLNGTAEGVRGRSDTSGRVQLTLPSAGPWRLNAVHMVAAEAGGVQWESFWTALSLDVSPAKG